MLKALISIAHPASPILTLPLQTCTASHQCANEARRLIADCRTCSASRGLNTAWTSTVTSVASSKRTKGKPWISGGKVTLGRRQIEQHCCRTGHKRCDHPTLGSRCEMPHEAWQSKNRTVSLLLMLKDSSCAFLSSDVFTHKHRSPLSQAKGGHMVRSRP